jgi:hypothetical protein
VFMVRVKINFGRLRVRGGVLLKKTAWFLVGCVVFLAGAAPGRDNVGVVSAHAKHHEHPTNHPPLFLTQ